MTRFFRDLAGPCLATQGSVVAIGAFDGLHRGHQALLAQLRARADACGLAAAVVTFEPLPRAFFSNEPLPRLGSARERLAGLVAAGIDVVLQLRFNHALSGTSAEAFVERVLRDRLATREVWIGEGFQFGHKRGGDLGLLQRMGESCGFRATAMPRVLLEDEHVSASRVRRLLAEGRLDDAATLLGRPFVIEGRVGYGHRLGRTLGYPTANIALRGRVSPLRGIFAVRVGLGEAECSWPGVASLGVRPTVNELPQPLLETHLFDFDGDLYGRRMAVQFVGKLRDEAKFDDLVALKAQMDRDADAARALLGMNPRLSGA